MIASQIWKITALARLIHSRRITMEINGEILVIIAGGLITLVSIIHKDCPQMPICIGSYVW
jgi:hypothetical protein